MKPGAEALPSQYLDPAIISYTVGNNTIQVADLRPEENGEVSHPKIVASQTCADSSSSRETCKGSGSDIRMPPGYHKFQNTTESSPMKPKDNSDFPNFFDQSSNNKACEPNKSVQECVNDQSKQNMGRTVSRSSNDPVQQQSVPGKHSMEGRPEVSSASPENLMGQQFGVGVHRKHSKQETNTSSSENLMGKQFGAGLSTQHPLASNSAPCNTQSESGRTIDSESHQQKRANSDGGVNTATKLYSDAARENQKGEKSKEADQQRQVSIVVINMRSSSVTHLFQCILLT